MSAAIGVETAFMAENFYPWHSIGRVSSRNIALAHTPKAAREPPTRCDYANVFSFKICVHFTHNFIFSFFVRAATGVRDENLKARALAAAKKSLGGKEATNRSILDVFAAAI